MKRVYSKKEYTDAIKDAGAVIALDTAIAGIIRECTISGGSIVDAINIVIKLRNSILDNLYSSIYLDKSEQFSLYTMVNDTIISDNRGATEIK